MRSTLSLILLLTSLLFVGTPASAQLQGEELEEARAMVREGRMEILAEELRLTQDEGPAFWKAYAAYQAELGPLSDRFSTLVTGYVEKYNAGEVTEDIAIAMVTEYLEIQGGYVAVRQKHLPVFMEILPARKAARFYQLEFKIDTELEFELSMVIPLVDLL